MKFSPESPVAVPPVSRAALWLMLAAAGGVPISLLCDFSYENTVGIDRFWAIPHTLTYLSVAFAGIIAIAMAFRARKLDSAAIALGSFRAPLGAWLVMWSVLAFLTALMFDRWWQSAYGLEGGIWHPPQLLKAIAFFALLIGAWLLVASWQNHSPESKGVAGAMVFPVAGALVLALIHVVTLQTHYPNHQHSAFFYKLGCATYPFVLTVVASAGRMRWSATVAAACYMAIFCACLWLLPLFPARPETGPIYNPMERLMPPPFPLLLFLPGLAMDFLARKFSGRDEWIRALAMGAAFFTAFLSVQWVFSEFLLMNLADNWVFAGGGKHWPFFLKINAEGRINFWHSPTEAMSVANAVLALGMALLATRLGLCIGAWMTKVQR